MIIIDNFRDYFDMKPFFEYIYYRVCKTFFKQDGVDGHRAVWAVTMFQTVVILDLIFIFFSLLWGRAALFPYSRTLGISAVVVLFVIIFLNGKVYDGRYNEFHLRWKDESENKRILKGFFVILSLILPWVGMFLLSKLK